MILADKITEERKKNGWSQEEMAAKIGVSRQAVSKWESAGSVPDLQRVIQLADLFGVSTDYLLKDDFGPDFKPNDMTLDATIVYPSTAVKSEKEETMRRVSMEEANQFLDMKKKSASVIANATLMCIISPALLILLVGLSENSMFHISEALAVGAGLIFLFGMVAIAVFMFITSGIKSKHMEYLEKEIFETEYGVSGMVKEKRRLYEPVFSRGIAIGVVLCIIAAVPLIVVGVMDAPDYICCAFTSILLLIVSIGVHMIIHVGIVKNSYDTLLQEGEFSRKEKHAKTKLDTFSGVYWCLTTAIYLGWSFYSMRWDFTWIIWPVAGVLFAAVSGIVRAMMGVDD